MLAAAHLTELLLCAEVRICNTVFDQLLCILLVQLLPLRLSVWPILPSYIRPCVHFNLGQSIAFAGLLRLVQFSAPCCAMVSDSVAWPDVVKSMKMFQQQLGQRATINNSIFDNYSWQMKLEATRQNMTGLALTWKAAQGLQTLPGTFQCWAKIESFASCLPESISSRFCHAGKCWTSNNASMPYIRAQTCNNSVRVETCFPCCGGITQCQGNTINKMACVPGKHIVQLQPDQTA